MANKIRIDGEFSGFIRGINKVSGELKKMGKGMSIKLDESELKKFRNFNINLWRDLSKDVDKYQAKLDKLHKAKASGNFNDYQIQQEKLLNKIISDRTSELRRQQDLYRNGNWLQRKGARIQGGAQPGGAADMFGGALGGVGDALSKMGPIGTIAGMGAGVYMGARALTAPRRALADENLRFMGLNQGAVGKGQLENLRQAGIESGYSATESMQTANALQRNVGNVRGREDLQNMFNTSRMTGMGIDEVAGYASTFRNSAVTGAGADLQANLEKTRELYKQAMISALDTSGALKFMQTTAEMTDQIANEGSADVESIKATLTNLSLNSDFYKANASRGEAAFRGGEGFFKSGEGTGLAMRAMNSMGMTKGMSAPEMLLMQKKGFTEKGGVGAGGLSAITQQLIGASSGLTKENWGDANKASKANAALSISQQFGISATNAEQLAEASMTGKQLSPAEIEKMFASDAEKQVNLQTSMDMSIKKNEAHLQEIMMDIGDILAPSMVNMEKYLYQLVDHFTGNAGQKSERVLGLEAMDANKTASKKRGTFGDDFRNWLTGGSADGDAAEATQRLAEAKIGKRKALNFNESNSFVRNSNAEGIMGMSSSALSGASPGWRKDQYSSLMGNYDKISKSYREQLEDINKMPEGKDKKHALAQLTDEKGAMSDLADAINKLVGYLGKQPVVKNW